MLFIKQSLSAATIFTALHPNADDKAVAVQITANTDRTTSFGGVSKESRGNSYTHHIFNNSRPPFNIDYKNHCLSDTARKFFNCYLISHSDDSPFCVLKNFFSTMAQALSKGCRHNTQDENSVNGKL